VWRKQQDVEGKRKVEGGTSGSRVRYSIPGLSTLDVDVLKCVSGREHVLNASNFGCAVALLAAEESV